MIYFIIELRGIQKWIDRMGWLVSNYVEQRQKFNTEIQFDNNEVLEKVEVLHKANYNYFIRYVSV